MTCTCGGNITVKITQERDEYEGSAVCERCGVERRATGATVDRVFVELEGSL